MKMFHSRLQSLIPLVISTLALNALGQETAPAASPQATATQQFREAFQLIQALPHPDAQMLGTCTAAGCWAPTTLLNDSTAELTRQLEPAIKLTLQGAKSAAADKGTEFTAEQRIALAKQTKALTGMLSLKARHEFQAGRTASAVEHLLTAFTISRRTGDRPNFMGKLIEIGASSLALQTLAALLPDLPKEQVSTLKERLDALPPAAPIAEVFREEFQFGLKDAKKRNQQLGPNQTMLEMFTELEPLYEALAKGSQTDPASFKTLIDSQKAEFKDNVLANHMAPLFATQHHSAIAEETRWAILRAGIDVVLHGPDSISTTHEVYGDEPFTLEQHALGFDIQSKLEYRNNLIRLHFGE